MQVNEAAKKCGMEDMCCVFRVLRSVEGITETSLCKVVGWLRESDGEGC